MALKFLIHLSSSLYARADTRTHIFSRASVDNGLKAFNPVLNNGFETLH